MELNRHMQSIEVSFSGFGRPLIADFPDILVSRFDLRESRV
jgi:hypothetical protein